MSQRNGSCLCGMVKISTAYVNKDIGACHCGMCQKWGGPYMALRCETAVSIEGEENITIYNSSEWAERGFCNVCGSHLFYRVKGTQAYFLSVGIFDDQDGFIFERQVFIDRKPSFYSFTNKTNDMTEAEIFAKYAAPPE